MNIKIDFTTNLPLEIGTPIITASPEVESEVNSSIIVEFIDDDTNKLIDFRLVKLDNKPVPGFRQYYTKWKLIFIISLLGGLINLSIYYNDKPIYKATLTFAMEEDKGGGGGGLSGALGLASSFGIDLGGAGGGFIASKKEIIEKLKVFDTDGITIIGYTHNITFENVSFSNPDNTFSFTTYIFGDYETDL